MSGPTGSFTLGVDLGQARDRTALVVLERTCGDAGTAYHVRHIDRLAAGTPYPSQVSKVRTLLRHLEQLGSVSLVVDATGVGRPVVDMLREAGHECLTQDGCNVAHDEVIVTADDAVEKAFAEVGEEPGKVCTHGLHSGVHLITPLLEIWMRCSQKL